MAVSSNTLFHFTSRYQTLVSILRDRGFWPKYCKEYDWNNDGKVNFAVSVSCFSDIPLSQIKDHIDFYGNYGIGISKKWAIENKQIAPVFYLTEPSMLNIAALRERFKLMNDTASEADKAYYKFYSFVKKYEGLTKNKRDKLVHRIFYNEREWRYIPDLCLSTFSFYPLNDMYDSVYTEENEKMKDCLAKFESSDIKYLILKTESERKKLLKDIDKIYKELSVQDLSSLKSKIITCEQINNDF